MRARRFVRLLAFAVAAWLCLAAPVLAQRRGQGRSGGGRSGRSAPSARPAPVDRPAAPAPAGDSLDLRRHGFSRLAVSAHPWSTVVAITVLVPGGSAQDDPTLSGSAWLLGESVRDALEEPLARNGATLTVTVDRNATRFQALAAPGAWETVYQTLIDGLFTAPPGFASLERRRADLVDVFDFENGAPVREFQRELAKLIGTESWSREPRGSAESVKRITASDLSALHRRTYRLGDAVVSIVGALDAAPGTAVYPGAGRDAVDGGNGGPVRRAGSGAPWSAGRRERLVRPVTSTWIGVAFPARRDVSRTVLELVVNRLQGELNPVPKDQGLYGTQVRLEDLPTGPVIVVEAAVLPEDAARWEARISSSMRAIDDRYGDESFFDLLRRHFRNAILVEQSAPEAEGLRIAMDLLRDGRVRDLQQEIDDLSGDALTRAISTLGQPRVLLFGPDLGR